MSQINGTCPIAAFVFGFNAFAEPLAKGKDVAYRTYIEFIDHYSLTDGDIPLVEANLEAESSKETFTDVSAGARQYVIDLEARDREEARAAQREEQAERGAQTRRAQRLPPPAWYPRRDFRENAVRGDNLLEQLASKKKGPP